MIDWEKHHRFMPVPGWCGPTTIWMVLSACGIVVPIVTIADHVWKEWYGTPPQLMAAYLATYFGSVGYEQEGTVGGIRQYLKEGMIVIVNWRDGNEGHYSIVSDVEKDKVQMVDSSREREWTYSVSVKEFYSTWFDCLADDNRLYQYGNLIWVDPKSVKHV
jgi:hypothetical protein